MNEHQIKAVCVAADNEMERLAGEIEDHQPSDESTPTSNELAAAREICRRFSNATIEISNPNDFPSDAEIANIIAKHRSEEVKTQKEIINGFIACYTALMNASPWTESNDMDIEDEMMCGIEILVQDRDELRQEVKELQRKAKALQDLRILMGYTNYASERVITLFEDDATNTLFIKVGNNESYFGSTLLEAIENAMKGQQ